MRSQGTVRAGILLAGLLFAGSASAQVASEPLPVESWASRQGVLDAQVSPGGTYLALLNVRSNKANPVVEIYRSAEMDKKPYTVGKRKMAVAKFHWLSDTRIVLGMREPADAGEQTERSNRIAIADVASEKLQILDGVAGSIEELLPGEPDKIIISLAETTPGTPEAALPAKFRPRSYWELNLDSGAVKLLIRGNTSLGNFDFDTRGHAWLARGFDQAKNEFTWHWRKSGATDWSEIMRMAEQDAGVFNVESIDLTKDDHLLVRANNGHDKVGLWSFNVNTRRFDELVERREDIDVYGVRFHSNQWKNPHLVTGVDYFKDKRHVVFFDEVEKADYERLQFAIPYAHDIEVNSRSRDGATMTVHNIGPRDPGTFYLLHEGKLQAVGSRQPLLRNSSLVDVQYIVYNARDGQPVPAFLTVPQGKPPFPLLVLPHDGPFVQETLGFDEWAQLLANYGYMVLQPQYRGSLGYGMQFHRAVFGGGRTGIAAMFNDLDDGATELVRRGLARSDRIAIFGWSFAAYAALQAVSREQPIYQCAVAGAAILTPQKHVNEQRYRLRGVGREEQTALWGNFDSALDSVERLRVPLLLVHGSADNRVLPDDIEQFRKLLDWNDRDYAWLELKNAGHQPTLFNARQREDLYEGLLDFLENDCGSGGL